MRFNVDVAKVTTKSCSNVLFDAAEEDDSNGLTSFGNSPQSLRNRSYLTATFIQSVHYDVNGFEVLDEWTRIIQSDVRNGVVVTVFFYRLTQ